MRAVQVEGPGSPTAVRDVEDPVAPPGGLLVRVLTSAVCGLDVAVAEGRLTERLDHDWPVTLGRSYAGTVEAVDDGVEDHDAGDRVLGVVLRPVVHEGTWSELIAVPADDAVARIPEGLDDEVAGVLGLAAVAADNLVAATRAREGSVVLVDGDVLGVAALVVALAAERGATVVATGTGAAADLLREQGASEVIDPGDDVVAALREARPDGVDALVDLADRHHDAFKATLGTLRDGGRATSAFGAATGSGRPDLDVTNVFLEPGPGQLAELAGRAVDGRLPVPIAATVGLDEVAQHLGGGASTPPGLVVVRVAGA